MLDDCIYTLALALLQSQQGYFPSNCHSSSDDDRTLTSLTFQWIQNAVAHLKGIQGGQDILLAHTWQ